MLRLPPLRDKRILAVAGLMALLALALDQASKIWVLQVLAAPPHSLPIMRYLSFDLVWNRGITFGLFSSHSEYMPMVWAALAAAMIVYLLGGLWQSRSRLAAVSSGMIIGGAIGNVIDRFRFGAVVDFIHVAYYPWVFNVADAAIVVGVGLLVIESLRGERSD